MPIPDKHMSVDEDASEVISVAEGGFELQEEYFHSKAELRRVLRDLGFTGSFEEPPTAVA